ncbi:MAG TPA: membrane protein insertase YidC [Acidimicrobiales bacterium]|nr:membrane protein insertase YidC [Acidimicrobiales bacterium]
MLVLASWRRAPGALLANLVSIKALFAAVALVLALAYSLVGSYGAGIFVVGAAVTLLTSPFAARAWRAQVARVRLEPELAAIRRRHSHDPQQAAAASLALLRDHGASPTAGCLALLLPAPLYLGLYQVLRGLTRRRPGSRLFQPLYLPHSTALFHALASSTTMGFWGVDLASTGTAALQASALSGALFVALLAITAAGGVLQQVLVRRALPRPSDQRAAGVQRVASLTPAIFALTGLGLPLAVTLYYAAVSLTRLAQQLMLIRLHPVS